MLVACLFGRGWGGFGRGCNRIVTSDIFLDIEWGIEQEPDVAAWFDELDREQFGHVAFHVDRLLVTGSTLRMPHSRALGRRVILLERRVR